jgi:uncharacterized membrane protein/protein-disulfide isomerase
MSSRTRWIILVLSLLGFGFAASSAWVHYRLVTEPNYISPCDISATFNCSQVYLSRYGAVAGVPVALGGMIWFGLVALLAAFTKPGTPGSAAATSYIFALSMVGLTVILYLGYASFFILKTGCLLCMGTYVAVIGIFIASGLAGSVSMGRLPARVGSDVRSVIAKPATLLAAILFLAGAASVVAFFPREGSLAAASAVPPAAAATGQAGGTQASVDAEFASAWAQQPRIDLGIPVAPAKVLVVKFIDWQCPSCRAAHQAYKPTLDKIAQSLPGGVREVIKDFPLSSRCNFTMSQDAHPAACEAAAAVRMARDRGKADEMIEFLFADQRGMTPAAVKAQAATLGVSDWDKEYAAKLPEIQRDIADAVALKVGRTPTYFINGVRAENEDGWIHPHYFELALQLELKKVGPAER